MGASSRAIGEYAKSPRFIYPLDPLSWRSLPTLSALSWPKYRLEHLVFLSYTMNFFILVWVYAISSVCEHISLSIKSMHRHSSKPKSDYIIHIKPFSDFSRAELFPSSFIWPLIILLNVCYWTFDCGLFIHLFSHTNLISF